jgi:N utilization substance protein A
LFELEVPEIQDGIVEIKSISREAGSRTKMAVYTADENVDPVGACVGSRGSRVQAIVDELFGEKIDIINWSDNPEKLISSALSPAKVESVIINDEGKSATVIVPDYQLSLAIGKEGQNVRLAAKLCGWKIDIKSHSQYFPDVDFEEYDDYDNAGDEIIEEVDYIEDVPADEEYSDELTAEETNEEIPSADEYEIVEVEETAPEKPKRGRKKKEPAGSVE